MILWQRLLDLYRHSDPKLAGVLEDNSKLTAIEQSGDMAWRKSRAAPGPAQVRAYFPRPPATPRNFWRNRTGRASAR